MDDDEQKAPSAIAMRDDVDANADGPLASPRLAQHGETATNNGNELSLELLNAIVENIPNMIFVKDAERLAFTLFNRAGEELLGVGRRDLLGKNDFDFFPTADAEFFQAKDRETLEKKVLVDIPEEPLQTKTGLRWLHTKKVPIVDEGGTPRYLLGISEDITARKNADAELRTAKADAEAANTELEAFAYSVAHDLRAPLRGIDGYSQALIEDYSDKLDADGRRYLHNVRLAAQRMARLIDDLLTLSRVTRGDIRREKTNLSALAQRVFDSLEKADLKSKGQKKRDCDLVIAESLIVDADARLLGILIENLIANAWKFTSKCSHAKIEVGSVKLDGDEVAYFVRDNGVGFDMKYVHKLFGAFQRLHGATEFEGTGVGLATVARIARRHGGRAWAEGKVDAGATFYFVLGAEEAQNDAPPASPSPEEDAKQDNKADDDDEKKENRA